MHLPFDINLCKYFFILISLTIVILSSLINTCESYLPVVITQTFRYGKFASKEKSSLVQKVEVPKSYFRHMYLSAAVIYLIFLKEIVTVYVFNGEVNECCKFVLNLTCGYERTARVPATHVFVAATLIVMQVFRRFYDTHFVSVFSKKATMNLSHYLIGMLYYPAVMLIVLSEAPKFAENGNVSTALRLEDIGTIELFAIFLFLWAWYHQHVTTVILANLRKNRKGEVVSQRYQIPEGDWFDLLSSPHSTAEIIMYTALTLLLYKNTSWLYVYLWVLSNQVETILLSHWWYQNHFKDFPKSRKALIPFVY